MLILPISTSQVTGTAGMSHHTCPQKDSFCKYGIIYKKTVSFRNTLGKSERAKCTLFFSIAPELFTGSLHEGEGRAVMGKCSGFAIAQKFLPLYSSFGYLARGNLKSENIAPPLPSR
jgi:hypothetical protein